MVGANKTLAFLFLLFAAIFLFPNVQAIEADELKAHYAVTLMELAGNQDYAIECGPADVLTNPKLLPNINGYPTSPAVCSMSLIDRDAKATMFSLNADEMRSTVIAHLKDYYQPDIDNNNHIQEEDIDLDACDNAEELDNNWWHCTGAVDNSFDIKIYYRLGQPMTYLITYSFSPSFDQSVWGNIVDFFAGLLGFNAEPTLGQDVDSFTRGYFAKATGEGSREVQAFYHAENPQANGRATLIFKDFSFDIREFAQGSYQVGTDNTQVLQFDNLAPTEWKKLTGALRIEPNGEAPIPGAECNDGSLDFGEECEIIEGEVEAAVSCEDLGYSFGEISCNSCRADTSGCFNCEDADGDGYYTRERLPNELRAVSNSIRYATMNGSFENTDAFLNPLVLSDFNTAEITSAARSYVSAFEACLEQNTEYECYQEINVGQDVGSLARGLDTSLSGTACAYGADCDLSAHAFSDQATTYRELTTAVRDAGAQPIFLLDAGDLALADFGTPPRNQNYEARLELAFTCAGLATITQTGNFIYHDKGQSTSQYDRGYQACRAGMNSVGVTLYYAQEPHAGLTETSGLIDGVATTNPRPFTKNKTIAGTNKGYKDLLLDNNAHLITINSNILGSIEANALYHIDAQTSQGNIEVIESLEQTYVSREDRGLATNIIVNTQTGDDIVYISQDTPLGLNNQDFDYSDCSGTLNAVTQEEIVASDEELANLPAGTFQYLTDWDCFLDDTVASSCPGGAQVFDCDDNNDTINPGEQEICGDGIDNNCDSLVDDEDPNCVDDGGSTGEACNSDGYCSPDTEDISTCADCLNSCTSQTLDDKELMHIQGEYKFYAHITTEGQGQIIVEASGADKGKSGRHCDFEFEKQQTGPLEKTFSFNPFSQDDVVIMHDDDGDEAKISFRPDGEGYKIYFEADDSTTAKRCWDASSDHANEYLPSSNPVTLNPYDYVSCNYSECENSILDCPRDNNFCVEVTDQIRTCQTFDLFDPECPPEQDPHPVRPNIVYQCP